MMKVDLAALGGQDFLGSSFYKSKGLRSVKGSPVLLVGDTRAASLEELGHPLVNRPFRTVSG